MTNGDLIRQMTDEQLVSLLSWGFVIECGIEVPTCDIGCELQEEFSPGCALKCGSWHKERAIREWIGEEVDSLLMAFSLVRNNK